MISLDKVLALAGAPAWLVVEQSIHTLDDLARAARACRLQDLPGLNISLENHILRCIQELRTADRGILMDVAHFQAAEVKRWLAGHRGVERAEIVGELRRGKGLVQRVEILAAAQDPAGVLRSFARSPLVRAMKPEKAPDVNSGLESSPEGALLSQHGGSAPCEVVSALGLPVTLHAIEPDRFGAALLNLTGSQAHLRRLREIESSPEGALFSQHGGSAPCEVVSTLGLPVTLHAVEPDRFGAALLNLTGSQAHLHRLRQIKPSPEGGALSLSKGALLSQPGGSAPCEEEIYRRLGLPFIPPELREDQGESEAAQAGKLPKLIAADQIQGDLHMHTNWADGLHPIEALAEAARARGYKYIAICDHSPLIEEADGLDEVRLAAQAEEIERLNRRYPDLTILRGLEVDIRANGELDMPDEALRELDLVMASIHTPYGQDTQTVTRRLVAAMEHPLVDIIGHPTGRLLKGPDLYMADVDELLRAAARTGTALEINAGPDRLDLSAEWARRARQYGVLLAIGSDAHSAQQLSWMQFGLATARRAWLEGANVLNALPLGELQERLKRHRAPG